MLSGISIWQLLILLVIVVLIFGTKRLRNLGGDLGSALKDFRGAMKDSEKNDDADVQARESHEDDPQVVDHVRRDESTPSQSQSQNRDGEHDRRDS